jgi:nudix motif 8
MTWRRCKTLSDAIPRLEKVFTEKSRSNDNNAFPLFTPSVHKSIWRSVPIDRTRQAAVLVPLVSIQGEPSLLFTTRSVHLSHPGDVSFPGGHLDVGIDDSLEATAVRETQEELLGDYPWGDIHILGQSTALPSKTGTPVTPVIGIFPYEVEIDSFPGNPDEVDDVFSVSLQELLDVESTEPLNRFNSDVPVFHTSDGKKIWGLTAIITKPLLHELFKVVFLQDN